MSKQEKVLYPPPEGFRNNAYIKSFEEYKKLYDESIAEPEKFWGRIAEELITWEEKWSEVMQWEFDTPDVKFFVGGRLNACYNCLDRHVREGKGDRIAIIWEGDDPSVSDTFTYSELHAHVCKFANVLKDLGVKKGDRVCVFLPMIPQLPIVMLACARIGAIHSVVFGGFSADSLKDRIVDSQSKILITADYGLRGGRKIPLKATVNEALKNPDTECIEKVITVRRVGDGVEMKGGRDLWWHELMDGASGQCECEVMDAEDPLFMLYTSGSTGKPKGVVHATGGYMVYTTCTFKYIFDYREEDIFWCTADVGWVTGHSYIVYGPLSYGATSVMFEGIPTYPTPSRFWQVVDKWKVTIFYTAPTAIRALIARGEDYVKRTSRKTLRLLGSVGEPINPDAWKWYYNVVGEGRCPIVDTWWQTETGGILISPLPGAFDLKPGSATFPFFGIVPSIVDDMGNAVEGKGTGKLCIDMPWPSMARTIYGDHKRFRETYFTMFPGKYFTGDGAMRDEDGYLWITGRIDDVINVSGHRLGTAEIESALVSHPKVAEAAVVGFPHEIKGQGIYAFVTLREEVARTDELKKQLVQWVRKQIGPIATPDKIQWADALPKTRSGKIMRRILRKIAAGQVEELGDTTTLADAEVVKKLIEGRQ